MPTSRHLANGKEIRRILADLGMKAESSHFTMDELRNNQAKSIAWAQEVGITQMITATLGAGNGGNTTTPRPGEKGGGRIQQDRHAVAAQAGIQQGLHNEGFELSMVDGKRTYDLLLDLLDSDAGKVSSSRCRRSRPVSSPPSTS